MPRFTDVMWGVNAGLACLNAVDSVALVVGVGHGWGMAQRTPMVPASVLSRLLAAIGAGSLLTAPSCGGQRVDDERPSRTEETSEDSSSNTRVQPSDSDSTTVPLESNAPETSVTSTSNPTTELGGETTDVTSSHPSSTMSVVTSDAPDVMCQYGDPQRFCMTVEQMESIARYGVGMRLPGDPPPRSDEEIAAGWVGQCMRHDWIATGCCNPAEAPGEAMDDGTCCYLACEGACCGRPLLVNGAMVVSAARATQEWLLQSGNRPSQKTSVVLDDEARSSLGQLWVEDALMEHASIASFAQFTLDLMRLGAPPDLLRDSQLAGLDEIEHSRIAFTIAERLTGVGLGPSELPLGALEAHDLNQAIAAAIHEGCVGETLAACLLSEQARRCTDPFIAEQLKRIAEDELRHAELAWRFVAWSLQSAGENARLVAQAAFEAAFDQVPGAPRELGLSADQLHAGGRLTKEQWCCTVAHAVKTVLKPAAQTLLGQVTKAHAETSAVLSA